MSEKISEYATSVTALASGDLMDVSKLISTSPDIYQSQKLNYSLLLTELNADLTINNLGNSDLTSTTNARIFALNGTTSSNYLSFTDGTNTILKIKGDGYVGIGINSASAALNVYHASDAIVSKFQRGTSSNSVIQILNSADSTYFGLSATGSDNGFSVGTSSDLTGNAILRVLSADGRLIQGLSNSVIADARLWNNSVNLYTDGASLKARYKNASGTASDLLIGSNLGSANLTSSDDARTFTLKTGTTATQNFQIKNSAGKSGFYYDGVGRVMFRTSTVPADIAGEPVNLVFGDATTGVTQNTYLVTTGASQYYAWRIYSGSSVLTNVDSRGEWAYKNMSDNSKVDVVIRTFGNGPRITTDSNNGGYWYDGYLHTHGANEMVKIGTSGSFNGYIIVNNSSGTVKNIISGKRSYEPTWFGEGLVLGGTRGRSATPFFDVMGSGSTSATTTALFQNSSSSTVAEFKDDLTSSFGGVVTAPQIINTPNVISVTSNAGTITRAYRINKFTNSSAATMTITMSTTAALDGDMVQVRIYDFSAAAQTISWVNTENSTITVPTTSNGSTTLPLTVGFQYNSATSKWRCIGSV